jgi:hypothetical protein
MRRWDIQSKNNKSKTWAKSKLFFILALFYFDLKCFLSKKKKSVESFFGIW